MIGVIPTGAPFAAASLVGTIDTSVFVTFVREVLASGLTPGDGVVMDNLDSWEAVAVRQAVDSVGARLLYLPPYSAGFQSDRADVE